ncbi:hypothetical protein SD3246_4470 [Salmonella enterica subsp. enterica serovar Dublin str. SD3246]|uniref:Uncharacterized protein n=1 Tax=Salmonella enterica subsp. enterica serovar Dublin str. SD3246 TaxID=909945 RepID=A0A8X6EWM7_SALDU|nr:hypothetical protein SD3246_4470 [Salmonella enterica subsp. enterica serovar Dublin str. SD3246]
MEFSLRLIHNPVFSVFLNYRYTSHLPDATKIKITSAIVIGLHK